MLGCNVMVETRVVESPVNVKAGLSASCMFVNVLPHSVVEVCGNKHVSKPGHYLWSSNKKIDFMLFSVSAEVARCSTKEMIYALLRCASRSNHDCIFRKTFLYIRHCRNKNVDLLGYHSTQNKQKNAFGALICLSLQKWLQFRKA